MRHLEAFCHRVAQGLEALTFQERQQLIRFVVERITMQNGRVRIETVIPMGEPAGKLRTNVAERSEASLRISEQALGLPGQQDRNYRRG